MLVNFYFKFLRNEAQYVDFEENLLRLRSSMLISTKISFMDQIN